MMTNNMHRRAVWLACVSAAVLAGCASDVKLNDNVPVETRTPAANTAPPTGGTGAATGQSSVAAVDVAGADAAAAAANRIVYFDFDSFVVKDDYRAVVETNAKVLNANRQKRIAAEGHTDERGGREYNLALGQKRAEAVQRAMVLLGVAEGQVEAVSFGEERPAATGSSEEAWAKNRRVELKDR
ncbi:MAG TPA: peptidoglycan-associated lipoprotein Pal [Ideonella sp.]|nr:peptidoglycan-associated lipoprotein Pal [Ideonella sp.]